MTKVVPILIALLLVSCGGSKTISFEIDDSTSLMIFTSHSKGSLFRDRKGDWYACSSNSSEQIDLSADQCASILGKTETVLDSFQYDPSVHRGPGTEAVIITFVGKNGFSIELMSNDGSLDDNTTQLIEAVGVILKGQNGSPNKSMEATPNGAPHG